MRKLMWNSGHRNLSLVSFFKEWRKILFVVLCYLVSMFSCLPVSLCPSVLLWQASLSISPCHPFRFAVLIYCVVETKHLLSSSTFIGFSPNIIRFPLDDLYTPSIFPFHVSTFSLLVLLCYGLYSTSDLYSIHRKIDSRPEDQQLRKYFSLLSSVIGSNYLCD